MCNSEKIVSNYIIEFGDTMDTDTKEAFKAVLRNSKEKNELYGKFEKASKEIDAIIDKHTNDNTKAYCFGLNDAKKIYAKYLEDV